MKPNEKQEKNSNKLIYILTLIWLIICVFSYILSKKIPDQTTKPLNDAGNQPANSEEAVGFPDDININDDSYLTNVLGIKNPWIDCNDLDEATDLSGLSIEVPQNISGYHGRYIQAIKDEMIQVVYGGKGEDAGLTIRKGKGQENISGVYSDFMEIVTISVDNISINTKGNDGLIYEADWTDTTNSYAIVTDNGITQDELIQLYVQIK